MTKLEYVCVYRDFDKKYKQVRLSHRLVKHLSRDCEALVGKKVLAFVDDGTESYRVCKLCMKTTGKQEAAADALARAEERQKVLLAIRVQRKEFFNTKPKYFTSCRPGIGKEKVLGETVHTQQYCPTLTHTVGFITLTPNEAARLKRCRNCIEWGHRFECEVDTSDLEKVE